MTYIVFYIANMLLLAVTAGEFMPLTPETRTNTLSLRGLARICTKQQAHRRRDWCFVCWDDSSVHQSGKSPGKIYTHVVVSCALSGFVVHDCTAISYVHRSRRPVRCDMVLLVPNREHVSSKQDIHYQRAH